MSTNEASAGYLLSGVAAGAADLLKSYVDHLVALNRVPKTIRTHISRIKRFLAFAGEHGVTHPSGVTQPLMLEYQRHLPEYVNKDGAGNSPTVQNQHMTVLVSFYSYLKQAGHLAHNPAMEVTYAKQPQRLPKAVLSHPEMKKLLRQPDISTVLGFRDRTIMELLYSTGIRRQELLSLDLQDVDVETGLIMVRQGKGGKDRIVPVGKVACRYLQSYLDGVRTEVLKHCPDPLTPALFPSTRTGRLRRNALAELIAKYARKARLHKTITPHTFRHTCATALVRNNAGIRHVQEMLGHAQLSTTQEYVRLTINDLKEAHSRFHPREKDAGD
ncbi:MAG: tyrosine-type recombinase/integrase [bacterium]|jgi:integrase/recombinase XerD